MHDMLLLNQYQSLAEAEQAAQKLRKRGILTFISSRTSYSFSRVFTGALRVGLWAVIDKQYDDAYKILVGAPCKVRYPLTEDEMKQLEIETSKIGPVVNSETVFNAALIVTAASLVAYMIFQIIANNA